MILEHPVILQCQNLWLALNGGEVVAFGDTYEEILCQVFAKR